MRMMGLSFRWMAPIEAFSWASLPVPIDYGAGVLFWRAGAQMVAGPAGSRFAYTSYDAEADVVTCGCWQSSLAEFALRVLTIYGVADVPVLPRYLDPYIRVVLAFAAGRHAWAAGEGAEGW